VTRENLDRWGVFLDGWVLSGEWTVDNGEWTIGSFSTYPVPNREAEGSGVLRVFEKYLELMSRKVYICTGFMSGKIYKSKWEGIGQKITT